MAFILEPEDGGQVFIEIFFSPLRLWRVGVQLLTSLDKTDLPSLFYHTPGSRGVIYECVTASNNVANVQNSTLKNRKII